MSNSLKLLTTLKDFEEISKTSKNGVLVLFSSPNNEKCSQIEEVVVELAASLKSVDVASVKVEAIEELSKICQVTSVPTVVIIEGGNLFGKVEGVAPRDVKKLVDQFVQKQSELKAQKDQLTDRLKKLVTQEKIMVFIKGSADKPYCGFSKKIISLLNSKNVKYGHFNIFEDEEVRQGLKEYSNWPTYPQLYVDGELLGGIDVVTEMEAEGDLDQALGVGA